LYNYGPAFACGFFLSSAFYPSLDRGADVAAGFAFEFLILVLFSRLLIDALMLVRHAEARAVDRWLLGSWVASLGLAFPLVLREGFGIFSLESRIAYLEGGGATLYVTYANLLVQGIQAGVLAQRLSLGRSVGKLGMVVILTNVAFSVVAGSKGGAFLWLAATLALVDFRRVRIRASTVLSATVPILAALWVMATVVSGFLGISRLEFAELAASRFFLNNDSRALALEAGGRMDRMIQLPAASVRGVSNKLGLGSTDPPLGSLLYEQEFGIANGTGGNSSTIALIHYYSPNSYSILPVVLAGMLATAIFVGVIQCQRVFRCRQRKLALTLSGMLLVQTLSQDFLAFQVLLPLFVAFTIGLMLTDRRGYVPRLS
jgi:hypothetical protein